MGFICVEQGKQKYSFSYDEFQWLELKKQYKNLRLTLPCCQSLAIPKTSKLGTQFFTHTSSSQCQLSKKSSETVYHQFCKYLVAKTLSKLGWKVEFEKPGMTPEGDNWIADIYATKNNNKIIIEVQWSRQSILNTASRHQKYLKSGIHRVIWFYRSQKPFLQFEDHFNYRTVEMPIFFIKLNDETKQIEVRGFKGPLSNADGNMELATFIEQLFSGNIIHSTNPKIQSYTAILTYRIRCWRCREFTNVVYRLIYAFGYQGKFCAYKTVDFNNCHLHQIEHFNHTDLRNRYKYGVLKKRYSNTEKKSYLSNGCWSCDALLGRYFNQYESKSAEYQISEYVPIPPNQPLDRTQLQKGFWFLI